MLNNINNLARFTTKTSYYWDLKPSASKTLRTKSELSPGVALLYGKLAEIIAVFKQYPGIHPAAKHFKHIEELRVVGSWFEIVFKAKLILRNSFKMQVRNYFAQHIGLVNKDFVWTRVLGPRAGFKGGERFAIGPYTKSYQVGGTNVFGTGAIHQKVVSTNFSPVVYNGPKFVK